MEKEYEILSIKNSDGSVTLSLNGRGGPIITASSMTEATSKFHEAFILCNAVHYLLNFKK